MEQVMTLPSSAPVQSKHTGLIILGGVLALGAGVGAWLVFFNKDENGNTKFQNWKNNSSAKDENEQKQETQQQQQQGAPSPIAVSGFPIEANTHNANTKNLQNALMNIWGQKISGAPSDYLGKNTMSALNKIGYDTPVSQADYTNILAHKSKLSTSSTPTTVSADKVNGKGLYSVYGNTKVFINEGDLSKVYKTVSKGGYIGKISGTKYGGAWYLISDGLYAVPVNQGVVVK
jgi:hypothetical protein